MPSFLGYRDAVSSEEIVVGTTFPELLPDDASSGHSFADTVLALTDIAPTEPPRLVSHGLELAHALRRVVGERPADLTAWEELLAFRKGPGADAFLVAPVPETRPASTDPLLDRAVEVRVLVDLLRKHSGLHAGQPLDRVLRRDSQQMKRVELEAYSVPVVLRVGAWFAVLEVADEHPRVLRDRILESFRGNAQKVGRFRYRRVEAPLVVSLAPVPLQEALHLHRLGIEGPLLAWSYTGGSPTLGVLAAHHLVLDGPGLACLRADLGQRVRAFRVALGLDAATADESLSEQYSARDAAPFAPFGWLPESNPPDASGRGARDGPARRGSTAPSARARLGEQQRTGGELSAPSLEIPPNMPAELADLLRDRKGARSWAGPMKLSGRPTQAPSIRFATVHRGAFSFSEFAYAYCRAQHDAMLRHDPHYRGQGFTFVVPHVPRLGTPDHNLGLRARPVLCSLHTRRALPEPLPAFRRRLLRRLEEADRGEDLLSQVLHDVLRLPLPAVVRSSVVRLFERAPRDGGTFLGGRGLFAYTSVPDDLVDPIAAHAGVYDGLFSGSCQERGGVSLTVIDRGSRRDLCAVGTGLFRPDASMDFFWERFASLLSTG